MNFKQLKQHAEQCELEADNMAYQIVKQRDEIGMLSTIQSICDFNVLYLHSLSPVILRYRSLEFLSKNVLKFNRKLSIKEMMLFDTIISNFDIKEFGDFEKFLK